MLIEYKGHKIFVSADTHGMYRRSFASSSQGITTRSLTNSRNRRSLVLLCHFDISDLLVFKVSSNKLFRHYVVAVQVAKEILRRFDYSLSNVSTETHLTPPFWIDMARLFEMYVLYLLRQAYGESIEFLVDGTCQKPDYIHKSESMILDAKYKPKYNGNSYFEILKFRIFEK